MDPKGKKPAVNEDPSSAAGPDWRSVFPPSVRVLNRVILVQAIYLCFDDSNATMAHKTAHLVENGICGMATDEHDYLKRLNQYIQDMPRIPEFLQGEGSSLNTPDSLKETSSTNPLLCLYQRHRQISFHCFNLGTLFATKLNFEMYKQRNQGISNRELSLHYALNQFKGEARIDLSNALNHSQTELGKRAASGQMINSLEEWYAAEIEGHIQNFICATTYNLDNLKRNKLQKYMQWLFNTDHGLYSSFLEDAKNHYRANISRDYLAALVDSTRNLQQQPLAGLPSDGNPVISPQPQLQQLQSVAPVGSAFNMPQQPLAGHLSDANTILLQQPLAGLPSDSNPVISPQSQLQQQQSVAQVDLTSNMAQMNEFIALSSQKMLYDDNDINTEGLFDESTSEAFQNFMQELQQPPLEVEQQPPAGNLPDGNAIPPPEQQPQ